MLADKVKGYFTCLIITQREDHKIIECFGSLLNSVIKDFQTNPNDFQNQSSCTDFELHHPILILRVFTLLICT